MQTIPILGLPLAVTNYHGAVAEIKQMAGDRSRAYAVEAANTMVVTLARHDPDFGKVMGHFDMTVPDGMPLVWCLNRHLPARQKLTGRVYGPELMLRTFEASQGDPQQAHFLLGGTSEVLAELTTNLSRRYAGAVIAGSYSPPFGPWDETEQQTIFAKIRNSGASLIWVGLGCPKQERWIAAQKDRLPPGVYFGIGAAFAFHAGKVKNAPDWLQRIGMEWAFRLIMEPRRLFVRYFKYNTLFLYYLFLGKSPVLNHS